MAKLTKKAIKKEVEDMYFKLQYMKKLYNDMCEEKNLFEQYYYSRSSKLGICESTIFRSFYDESHHYILDVFSDYADICRKLYPIACDLYNSIKQFFFSSMKKHNIDVQAILDNRNYRAKTKIIFRNYKPRPIIEL